MTDQIDDILQSEADQWLTALPQYQRSRIQQLLDSGSSYEKAMQQWIDAIPENTFPFGTEKPQSLFLEKVLDEIEKFLCGDETYQSERQELLSSSELIQTTVVSVVSSAIAPKVGAAATYIMPIAALIFMTMGKITLNAWCQIRKESKATN